MYLHLSEANDNSDKAAIMYGPLVLAGAMGTNGMEAPAPFSNPKLYNDYYTYDYNVPANLKTSLNIDKANLSKSVIKQNGLVFEVANQDIRLEPIHKIHHQRYIVYWDITK
jgi:hypothetical protein